MLGFFVNISIKKKKRKIRMLEANINTGHFHYTVQTEQALLINQGKSLHQKGFMPFT